MCISPGPHSEGLKSLGPQTRQGQSPALADSRRRSCFLLTSGFTPELQGEEGVSDPSSLPLKFWALSQQQPGLQTGVTPGGQQRNKAVRLSSLPSASPPPLGGGAPIPPPTPSWSSPSKGPDQAPPSHLQGGWGDNKQDWLRGDQSFKCAVPLLTAASSENFQNKF